jgi:hypothetical protein
VPVVELRILEAREGHVEADDEEFVAAEERFAGLVQQAVGTVRVVVHPERRPLAVRREDVLVKLAEFKGVRPAG